MSAKFTAPKIPHRFFKWYCRADRYEEIHGDLEEIFYERAEKKGLTKARLWYVLDVIRCCQPYAWKKSASSGNRFTVYANYYKVALRILFKTPLSSFINVFGLSVGIGMCTLIYGFAHWVISTDQFHEHKNEVYLATFMANRDGERQQHGQTPRPLGEMLRGDFTHIKNVCRIEDRNIVMKHDDNVFHERVRFVDPDFLEMLTFPMKWGEASSLSDITSIILSEDMAIKYFGDENPVGRDILMKFDEHRSQVFKITGVAQEFPKAITIRFNFLVNFDNLKLADPGYDFNDWAAFVNATLIRVDDPSDLKNVEKSMTKYISLQNQAAEEDWAITSFVFEPLATLHIASEHIHGDISRSSDSNYKSIVFLAFMGIFMLALACFNYINIAIVSAAKRLKEIGVRKTIGASRGKVVAQFLSENILITSFALIFGLFLGATVFIPGFQFLNSFDMGFSVFDATLWLYLSIVLLITGAASGIYPALYISRFEVVKIMKGAVQFGKKNPLTKVFLGFQLVIACIFITSAAMFSQNSAYMTKRSWGYDQKRSVYAEVPTLAAFEQLEAAMAQTPDVISISGSNHHIGKRHTTTVVHMPERQYEVDELAVDAHYLQTLGVPFKEGRAFRDHSETDKRAVVVNELLVKSLGLTQPIGQLLKIDSTQYEIIGVVADFHSYDFFNKIHPTLFRLSDRNDFHFISLRTQAGAEQKTYKALQTQWATLFPETPFQGGFQEDVWGGYYEEMSVHATVWQVVAAIAILLAGLGLYGLITLNVAGRVREFSIRKVLGAGLKNILSIIATQYTWLFAIALALGAPVAYILNKIVFDLAYEYHLPMSYSSVAFSVAVLIAVLLITVSTQIRKVENSNPVNGLKVE